MTPGEALHLRKRLLSTCDPGAWSIRKIDQEMRVVSQLPFSAHDAHYLTFKDLLLFVLFSFECTNRSVRPGMPSKLTCLPSILQSPWCVLLLSGRLEPGSRKGGAWEPQGPGLIIDTSSFMGRQRRESSELPDPTTLEPGHNLGLPDVSSVMSFLLTLFRVEIWSFTNE